MMHTGDVAAAPLTLEHGSKRSLRYAAMAAAVAALALYALTLRGTLVYDDVAIAREDPRLYDPHHWSEYITGGYWQLSADHLWRPLVSLSIAVQVWLGGSSTWHLHLVNVLLHAGVSALVALLAGRLVGSRAAWVSGLLFAAHPVHVEVVAGIVGRAELLCALGYLGALLLFLTRPLTLARVLGIFACFAVALLSKEQGMLLPVLLLIWGLVRRPRGPVCPAEKRAMLVLSLLLCWSLAAYVVYRESILPFSVNRNFFDWTFNPLLRAKGIDRWLLPVAWLGRYVQLLVAPVWLSPDYGFPITKSSVQLTDPYLYLGLAVMLASMILLIASLKRHWNRIALCLLGLGISYALASNLATIIPVSIAERLMYLPSVFFLLLLSFAVMRLRRPILLPVLASVLVLASVRTVTYAARWRDPMTLFATSAKEHPESVHLQLLLSNELIEAGRLEEAQEATSRAIHLAPDYWQAWGGDAIAAKAHGDMARAQASATRRFILLVDGPDGRSARHPATQPLPGSQHAR